MTLEGERIVIVNNQSPSYRLRSVSHTDLFSDERGLVLRHETDFSFPDYALPSSCSVVCSEAFGEHIYFSVDRVEASDQKGFYIRETELVETGRWEAKPQSLYFPLDPKYRRIRLSIYSKNKPQSGLLTWHVEFRYPT